MKPCPRCKKILPATAEFFHPSNRTSSGNPLGLESWCKECHKERRYERIKRDPERFKMLSRMSQERNRPRVLANAKRIARRNKALALIAYSQNPPSCQCCGETLFEFLSIDHINGNGNAHRRSINRKNIFGYLRARGWPEGYRVLCMNCNISHGFYGYCPHKSTPFDISSCLELRRSGSRGQRDLKAERDSKENNNAAISHPVTSPCVTVPPPLF